MTLNLSINGLFDWLAKHFSTEIPEDERIHPEFKFHNHDGGFHYNASGIGPVDDTHRLQIFLNEDELSKLTHSPFIGKIAPNENPDFSYDYCAFFYLNGDQQFSSLKKWAREEGFKLVIEHHGPPQGSEPHPHK